MKVRNKIKNRLQYLQLIDFDIDLFLHIGLTEGK